MPLHACNELPDYAEKIFQILLVEAVQFCSLLGGVIFLISNYKIDIVREYRTGECDDNTHE